MGIPIVVLNSLEAVSELLDRQGAVSSSRPRSAMFDMCVQPPFAVPPRSHAQGGHERYADARHAVRRRVARAPPRLPRREPARARGAVLEAEQTHLFLRELLREPSSFLGATQWCAACWQPPPLNADIVFQVPWRCAIAPRLRARTADSAVQRSCFA
jgi:hypothetical protein